MTSVVRELIPERGLPPVALPKKIFFVGIGGVGMAGLATLLHDLGHSVSGSDANKSDFSSGLESRGIYFCLGHKAEDLPTDCDLVVRTPAVKEDNPILLWAHEVGIPVCSRGKMLAALFNVRAGVAVAGTHGKTTTSAMMVHMLKAISYDGGFFVGGLSGRLSEMSVLGSEPLFITEADESDGSLVDYHAEWAVLTNVEFDHAETFEDDAALQACFSQFVDNAKQVVYNLDDDGCRAVVASHPKSISYGVSEAADCSAQNMVLSAGEVTFDFVIGDDSIPVHLFVDGLHNAMDALAALTFMHCQGFDIAIAAQSLASYKAVNRRFEMLSEAPRWIISDYAHHPTEIRMAVDSALRLGSNTLWVIFQPHRFSRTKALKEQFPAAFAGADELVICPVYSASECPIEGGRHQDLYAAFHPEEGFVVSLADSLNQAWEYVRNRWHDGDALLIAGAGDVEQIASWAWAELLNQN